MLCDRLKSFEEDPETFDPIVKAVLKAIFAHLYVAWIHPFGDGNGRTARALFMWSMLRSGYTWFRSLSISRAVYQAKGR